MKRSVTIALGAVTSAAALVATAPATLLDARLDRASSGTLRLAEARGTVWSGSGIVEARGANFRAIAAKHVSWRVAPAALLGGKLEAAVMTHDSDTPFSIVATLARVEIANAQLALPAEILGWAAPRLSTLQPTGTLELRIEQLTIDRAGVDGSGVAKWQRAGSAASNVFPLGSYELRFDSANGGQRATLRTLEGPLQLEGTGSWARHGRPRLDVSAEVPAMHREALSPLLRLIAAERGEGRFQLELK